jgi:transcriptional regulator with XRE-family HTH domain
MLIEIQDQLRMRMEELGINPVELGKRIGVTSQTVRCWLNGRNFPNKKMTPVIERELGIKLDYSEGATAHRNTVRDSVQKSAADAMVAINKLPVSVQVLFHKLAEAYEQNHSASHQEAKTQVCRQCKGPTPNVKQRPPVYKRGNSYAARADADRMPARQPTGWSD